MLLRRLRYPKTTGLILRRTYPDLYKSHIIKLFEEFPETRDWYNQQNKELVLPNKSRLFFGSALNEADMSNFYSAEFADIMVDEAQEFSQGELEQLSGSNRCTSNSEITPKMIYTFMPGVSESGLPPKGLSYLKRVFVDQELRGHESSQQWAFVQAFSWDNIEWARKELARDGIGCADHNPRNPQCGCVECVFYSWPEDERREYFLARTEYGANLASITNENLRDAWLYGKWDTFQGQYFPNFNIAKHVAKREEVQKMLKPWHKRWISGDWGFDHPHDIQWHAQDEDGRIITYREQWGREMGETELGTLIGKLTGSEKISAFPFSWDAFGKLNKRTRKSITTMIAEAMPDGIPKPHPADASGGSRISGWRLMYQMIDAGMWIISEDCPKLIECIPTLLRDHKNTEDVLKMDYSENYIGDDPADCARYGLQYMRGPSKKPFSERMREELAALPVEGSDRYIRHLQLKQKEKQNNPGVFYLGRGRRR